jgi:GT2 family glycosyltransferase
LDSCLGSLLAAESMIRPEIIVVDNASTDGSADLVAERFPTVDLVRSDTNLGFASACNRAAARANGRHLLFLNPDTRVKPGLFEALLDVAARRPEAGIYGGRTLTPDDDLDPKSCWGLPSLWSTVCFASGLSTVFRGSRLFDPESMGRWRRDTEREVGMVTGCLLMIDRELWRRLSGFDERYFMYGEDADLNLRARGLGARPVITPEAVITHVVGASAAAPARLVLIMRGKATLARRHRNRLGAGVTIGLLLAGTALRALGAAALRRSRPGGAADSPWRHAWRERATWRAGWSER